MMNNQQMEMEFNGKPFARPSQRRQRRMPGARWWFSQMRAVVRSTMEWGGSASGRPEQIDLISGRL